MLLNSTARVSSRRNPDNLGRNHSRQRENPHSLCAASQQPPARLPSRPATAKCSIIHTLAFSRLRSKAPSRTVILPPHTDTPLLWSRSSSLGHAYSQAPPTSPWLSQSPSSLHFSEPTRHDVFSGGSRAFGAGAVRCGGCVLHR